ncbi:MAG: glycosyltransferase family 4 protein [Deltaproteobacteria bacterium]|nr:glycosyltransferase family 4 protein [Deltaproteobacteria bacterium]
MKRTTGLFVCNCYYPLSAGVGNATANLCRALKEYGGIDPVVITPKRSQSPDREVHQGVTVIRVPGGVWAGNPVLSFLYYPWFAIHLLREVVRYKPLFVLFQTAWEGGPLIPLVRMVSKTLVVVHTHADVHYASRFESWARLAYGRADIVMGTTTQYLRDVESRYMRADAVLLPNAYYAPRLPESREELRSRYGYSPGFVHVTAVGRMVYELDLETKGFSHLIEAAAKVPGVWLHMFGTGPARQRYERMAENLGVALRCTFYGHQPGDVLLRHLKAGDVLVISSLNEGLSMALIEALCLGVPIIATRTAGALDYIRNGYNGLLIPPGDTASLVEALEYATREPDRLARMGREGRLTFERSFAPPVIASEFVQVISRVLESRRMRTRTPVETT